MIRRLATETPEFGLRRAGIGQQLGLNQCAGAGQTAVGPLVSTLRALTVLLAVFAGIGGACLSAVAKASPEEADLRVPESQGQTPAADLQNQAETPAAAARETRSDSYTARYADSRAAIKNYSDQKLTTLAGRWGLLSEPQRDAVLAETRDRMLQQMAIVRSGGRAGERMLSPRELSSLTVARQGRVGSQLLLELPSLVAPLSGSGSGSGSASGSVSSPHLRSQRVPSASFSERPLATPGKGQIHIKRRYGRKVVRSDGRVVQQLETRVYQVTQGDPSRAFGRMGFERRRQQQSQLRDPGSLVAPNSQPRQGVFRVADPTP